MKRTVIILVLLTSFASFAQAQFSQFHVGGAFPTSKFGDGDAGSDRLPGSDKGFAKTGFTVGFKYYGPLQVENLSWVFALQGFYNGLNSDVKDYIEESNFEDITLSKYLNFPATVGANYAFPVTETVKIYGEAGIGANFSMPTKTSRKNHSTYADDEYKITPMFAFAYGLEAGLFINGKYSLGVRYNNLGSYKYKYEYHAEGYEVDKRKYSRALPITIVSLCVGVLISPTKEKKQ
ncbi:MAG: porin family protein [Prevotellaceae bacterium]|jgi:hypothetical protein|nr:porin family protein [Prevotellaceae bacterium]